MSAQLVRNTVWSILDIALYPVLMVLATPIFIKFLGLEQYGIWMIATTVNLFINVLHFSIGDTTIRAVAALRAQENTASIAEVINKNWSFAIKTSLLALLIGAVVSFSGIIQSVFHIPAAAYHASQYITFLAFAITAVKFLELLFLSVFKAYERFDRSALLSLVSRNSTILTALVLVVFKQTLLIVFIGMLLISIVNIVLQWYVLKRHFSFLYFRPNTSVSLRFDSNNQQWYWLQSCIGSFGFLSDRIIVGYFTDVKTTGLYATATLVGSQLHNALTALGGFLFPKVAAQQKDKRTEVENLYYNARAIIGGIGWLGIFVLLFTGSYLFRWWLGEETYNLSKTFINFYLVYIVFMIAVIVPFQFINGTDELRHNTWLELRMRLSHIVCMCLGISYGGVNGLLWGLIIATVLNLELYYRFFHQQILRKANVYAGISALLPLMSFMVFLMFENFYVQLVCFVFFVLSYYFVYLKPATFQFWKKH